MLHRLYVLNATLLLVHELDSAFWREWDVLGLPGGEAGSLALGALRTPAAAAPRASP